MTPPERLQDVIAEMREWAHGEGCFNDDPDGEPLLCVYYSQQAFLSLCDRIEAAAALSGWQPIESAPKDGTEFLAVTQSGTQRIDRFLSAKQGQWNARSLFWEEAPGDCYKLWQPLPATPPSEG